MPPLSLRHPVSSFFSKHSDLPLFKTMLSHFYSMVNVQFWFLNHEKHFKMCCFHTNLNILNLLLLYFPVAPQHHLIFVVSSQQPPSYRLSVDRIAVSRRKVPFLWKNRFYNKCSMSTLKTALEKWPITSYDWGGVPHANLLRACVNAGVRKE